jgi:hypothetical protein
MLGLPEMSRSFRCDAARPIMSRTSVARRAGYWCRLIVSEFLRDSRNRVGPNGLLVYQMKVSGVHRLSLTNTYDSFRMATEVVAQRAG